MELIDVNTILDEQFGKSGTDKRNECLKQARTELKADLRYYARRGEKVTLKDIFSFRQ